MLDPTSVKGAQPRLDMSMTMMWTVKCDQPWGGHWPSSPRGEGTEDPGPQHSPPHWCTGLSTHKSERMKMALQNQGWVQKAGVLRNTHGNRARTGSAPREYRKRKGSNKATHTTRVTLWGLCAPGSHRPRLLRHSSRGWFPAARAAPGNVNIQWNLG